MGGAERVMPTVVRLFAVAAGSALVWGLSTGTQWAVVSGVAVMAMVGPLLTLAEISAWRRRGSGG